MKKGKVVVCKSGKDRWNVEILSQENDGLQKTVRNNEELIELVVNFVEFTYDIYIEIHDDYIMYKGYKIPKKDILSKVPHAELKTSKDVAENTVSLYYTIKDFVESVNDTCKKDNCIVEFTL